MCGANALAVINSTTDNSSTEDVRDGDCIVAALSVFSNDQLSTDSWILKRYWRLIGLDGVGACGGGVKSSSRKKVESKMAAT